MTQARVAAALLAADVFAQLVCLGANGPLLATLAATLNIGVTTAAILLTKPEARFWRSALPLLACLGLLIGWAALPGILPSLMPRAALPTAILRRPAPDLFLSGFARLIGGAALLLAAGVVGYRRQAMRVTIDWIIGLGACQIIIGLLLRGIDPDHVWGFAKTITLDRFSGTMINVNANACAAAVTAVLAFARSQALVREGASGGMMPGLARVACILITVAALGACIIAGSRMALVLTILAICLLTALDPVSRRTALSRVGLFVLAGCAAGIGILLLMVGGATAVDRFATLGNDSVDRIQIWSHYWSLARSAPLFGYGLAAFGETNAASLTTAANAYAFWYINSAHNELLELIIEGGWVHLVLILLAGGTAFVTILRHAPRRDDPTVRGAYASILVILASAMVDIALDVPAVSALLLLLVGLLWGWALRAGNRTIATVPDR